ncbi:DNA polymerase domain-containing protein [Spongiactinospora rosea]|uniref:DNA polymerase domain-containing protein n=1 Tax=Spongiactinospora rosea TaxID=2248750 RepID=A0A366LZE6_9ACTN|nr:non-homologous end-joining DNA ligase [Spongiactinospora rosea]RBQ19315.1 DNA polymerase domain-containing protein [Spongiactinospora rosea]
MANAQVVAVAGRQVRITSPDKVMFPATGHTKLDLVRYYLDVAGGALRGVAGRPMILKRFVRGVDAEAFFQKRAPDKRPEWIEVAELRYPSGRSAEEVVVRDAAQLAWVVNLGCVDLNPHPVPAEDLDHPDELRIDLDPVPGVEWPQIVRVAQVVRRVLTDFGLPAWPKTSGSRGFHVYARITPHWTFPQVRQAAEAVAREVESRAPDLATSRWWKEERHGVFVDYNQNARDRTVASAYSVRPTPDARVSTPLAWDEVEGRRPEEFTIDTVPARYAEIGDPWADIGREPGSLTGLLDFAASLPPHPSQKGEIPVIEIARARTRAEAMAGLARWKSRHPDVAARLRPADVLVDGMRGRSSVWYRIRVNLQHVPEPERPAQEPLESDYDPWAALRGGDG